MFTEKRSGQENILALALMRVAILRPKERLLLYELLDSEADFLKLTQTKLSALIGRSVKSLKFSPEEHIQQAEQDQKYLTFRNIKCTFYYDKDYPALLKTIYDPPLVLFYRGNMEISGRQAVAVVGTRRPDKNGSRAAYRFGYECGAAGIPVVSGLAMGIDRETHRGCCDNKGKAIAVLGSGVDCVFPVSNRRLAESILNNDGAIVSEYPPGTLPAKYHYPARNRIISGLSDSVVIIQAPERSGALITADYALEQGRDLVVHEAGNNGICCAGTHTLIQDGARVISSCKDLFFDAKNENTEVNLIDIYNRALEKYDRVQEMTHMIEMEIKEKVIQKNGEYYWRN